MTVGTLNDDEPANFSAAQAQPRDWTQGQFYKDMTEFYASPKRKKLDCHIKASCDPTKTNYSKQSFALRSIKDGDYSISGSSHLRSPAASPGRSPTNQSTSPAKREPIAVHNNKQSVKKTFAKNQSLRASTASAHLPMMETNYQDFSPIEERHSM